jgi:hypothetical protein
MCLTAAAPYKLQDRRAAARQRFGGGSFFRQLCRVYSGSRRGAGDAGPDSVLPLDRVGGIHAAMIVLIDRKGSSSSEPWSPVTGCETGMLWWDAMLKGGWGARLKLS